MTRAERRDMTPKAITPRIQPATHAWLSRIWDNPTGGATDALDALPSLYRTALDEMRSRCEFAPNELRLILDALNGCILTAGMYGGHVLAEVADSISLNGLDTKWGVDGAILVERLQRLTSFQRAALELWCAEFWRAAPERDEDVGEGDRSLERLNEPDHEARMLGRLTLATREQILGK